MPAGRKIPRQPPTAPSRPAAPEDEAEVDPGLMKAAGELGRAWSAIRACEACSRSSADRAFGTGRPRAPVMLVKEAPSRDDLEASDAFASEAEPLAKAFEALGIPMSWLFGATAVRCGHAPAAGDEVEACAGHLLAEIEAVGPSVLVVFGDRAAQGVRALSGRCGLRVPPEGGRGVPVRIRSDLTLLITEPLPEGVTQKEAKRRLWRDLQAVPGILGAR